MTQSEICVPDAHHRPIRSYVRREGRMTPAQNQALERLWPRYGIDAPASTLDLAALFGRCAPCALEIGFGNGKALLARAAAEPHMNFIGVEVHRPGVGYLLRHLEEQGLDNVRVSRADAVDVLGHWLAPQSLDEVMLYFPDPWPKKRHHKRRIVQPAFAAFVASRLKPGGLWRLATDWAPYAEHMQDILKATPGLTNAEPGGAFAPRPESRPQTRFERRGRKLGHEIFDLAYRRSDSAG